MTSHTAPMDAATARRVCVAASVDPRTLRKYLRGEPVRGMPRHRIATALRALGLDLPRPTSGRGGAASEREGL